MTKSNNFAFQKRGCDHREFRWNRSRQNLQKFTFLLTKIKHLRRLRISCVKVGKKRKKFYCFNKNMVKKHLKAVN